MQRRYVVTGFALVAVTALVGTTVAGDRRQRRRWSGRQTGG
jgi:hypothetical protein